MQPCNYTQQWLDLLIKQPLVENSSPILKEGAIFGLVESCSTNKPLNKRLSRGQKAPPSFQWDQCDDTSDPATTGSWDKTQKDFLTRTAEAGSAFTVWGLLWISYFTYSSISLVLSLRILSLFLLLLLWSIYWQVATSVKLHYCHLQKYHCFFYQFHLFRLMSHVSLHQKIAHGGKRVIIIGSSYPVTLKGQASWILDGWMDGWMDDGWMDGWMDGWIGTLYWHICWV